MQQALKILSSIKIAKPCPASWSAMTGDQRTRFCGQCQKNVFNISEMEAEEAVALIREKEGKVCLRLYRRQDGTVLTADCPVGIRLLRRGLVRLVGAAAACFGALIWVTMLIPNRWPRLQVTRATKYEPARFVNATALRVQRWLELENHYARSGQEIMGGAGSIDAETRAMLNEFRDCDSYLATAKGRLQ